MAWLSGWSRRKKVTITGTTAGAQTNFQLMLNVVYDSDMQADFDDLRFTLADGVTLVDFWLESKVDSTSAIVWIEVPSVPANPATVDIYMYYGNPSAASTSNGTNTFLVFSTGSDVASWTNTVTNVDGELRFAWGGSTASNKQISVLSPWIIEYRFRNEATTNQNLYVMIGDGTGTAYPTNRNAAGWKDSGVTTWLVGSSAAPVTIYSSLALSTYYIGKHIRVGAGNYNHYLYAANRTLLGSTLGTSFFYNGEVNPITAISFCSGSGAWYINTYVPWIFIRKYASPEPTYGTGNEEVHNWFLLAVRNELQGIRGING